MSLKDKIPQILAHVKYVQVNQTIQEQKLYEVYEGQLQKYVEDSIRAEFEAKAAERAIQRISPVNLLPKLVNKISTVYNNGVTRSAVDNEVDSELLAYYEDSMDLNTRLNFSNKMINLFKYCAVEPYLYKGKPEIRVLNPTQFCVYSDDIQNPTVPTEFIKFMGKVQSIQQRTDTDGAKTRSAEEEIRIINLYYIYSATEFLIVDAEGGIRYELMGDNQEGINPYGVIPFIYINLSESLLIPLPNMDMLTNTILIPKLLTDLNYATKFQSHAIVYGIDVDAADIQANPDSFWDIKSVDGEGKSPQLGTIKPTVDVDKVLTLIKTTIDLWLDSLGLKSTATSGFTQDNASSGIAKAIDEADATAIRKEQKQVYLNVEKRLWNLIPIMHNVWVSNLQLTSVKDFSTDFNPSIQIEDPAVYQDSKVVLENIIIKLGSNLTSYKRALAEANQDLNSTELEELMAEILEEKETAAKLNIVKEVAEKKVEDTDKDTEE